MPASKLGTDLLTHHWTNASVFLHAVQEEHQFPMWDPIIMAGQPIIGNPAIIDCYPAWWLLLILPKAAALNAMYLLHVEIAGVGMLLLLRVGYRTSRTAALLGAIMFMLAPKYTGHLAAGHPEMVFPAFWLPWAILCVMLALERRQVYWAALAGLPLALGYLLHVQTFFFSVFYTGLYLLWRLVIDWRGLRAALQQAVLSAIVPISLIILAAVQLFPFMTLLAHASRQQLSLADGSWWSLPPSLLGGIVFMPRTQFPEWIMYSGVLPLGLGLVALLKPRSRDVRFLMGFSTFTVIFALGTSTPLYEFMFRFVPGFGFLRNPPRMMFIGAMTVAILAALGWDTLRESVAQQRLRRLLPLITWISGVLLVVLIGGYIVLFRSVPVHVIRTGGLIAAVLLLLWIVARHGIYGKPARTWTAAFALILLLVDLLPTAWHFITPTPQAQALPANPVLDYIQAQGGLYRAYALQGNLSYAQAAERSIQLLDGQQSFQLATMTKLINYAAGCDFSGFSAGVPSCTTGEAGKDAAQKTHSDARLLGLLNVRWLAASFPIEANGIEPVGTFGTLNLYENTQVKPRAFVVGTVEVVKDDSVVLSKLAGTDVQQVAFSAEGEPLKGESVAATVIEYTDNYQVIETTTRQPGMLVESDAWVDGWQATDNGQAVPLERIDVGLRGVRLMAPGKHQVVIFYQPPLAIPGLITTTIALIGLLVWTIARQKFPHIGGKDRALANL